MPDQRFSEACINAWSRLRVTSLRLKAAEAELREAQREHALANKELEQIERLYYQRSDSENHG